MTDAELLDWLADELVIEGFHNVEQDVHEIAMLMAFVEDTDSEPEPRHYRAALREMIRRAAQQQPASDGGENAA